MSKALIVMGFACVGIMMMSCSSTSRLCVSDISYQSIRNAHVGGTPLNATALDSATILVEPVIDSNGNINVNVTNLTDKIMTIDRTKSFYVSPTGESTIYYDPTVRTTTNSVTTGHTTGANVNLGTIGRVVGAGGAFGKILNGVNVGGSNTMANTTTNTTYTIDTPTGSIAPHGRASMGRTFTVGNTGASFLSSLSSQNTMKANIFRQYTLGESYCKFSICITYSIDDGATYKKFVSEYYCNTAIVSPVKNSGKVYKVNDALRTILMEKSDAFDEPWFLMHFNANITTNTQNYINNQLYDYQ